MHDFSDLLIPSAQLELPFNKHGMLRVIGTGGFGQVKKLRAPLRFWVIPACFPKLRV